MFNIPLAIAIAISLNSASNFSLSASLFIKPASTRTAGIFVRLRTTKLGRSITPLTSKPRFANSLFIFRANVAFIPWSLNTRVSTPVPVLGVGSAFL